MPTFSILSNTYPDPYYTIRKIRKATRYIDENSSIRINKAPLPVIKDMLLYSLRDCEAFVEEDVFDSCDASQFYCFSVFYHIYLKEYRENDFASLDNCQRVFVEYQHFLWQIFTAYKRHGGWIREKLPDLKLLDLKNLTAQIDAMIQWKRKIECGQF